MHRHSTVRASSNVRPTVAVAAANCATARAAFAKSDPSPGPVPKEMNNTTEMYPDQTVGEVPPKVP